MSKINRALFNQIVESFEQDHEIPIEFMKIIAKGFTEIEEHIFLKFYNKRIPRSPINKSKEFLFDSTGIECWVNDICIDYEDHSNHMQIGFIFAAKLMKKWKRSKFYRPACLLLSTDDERTKLKFHLKRDGETWFADDLEGYDASGICVLEV